MGEKQAVYVRKGVRANEHGGFTDRPEGKLANLYNTVACLCVKSSCAVTVAAQRCLLV